MRVIVCGSRGWKDAKLIELIIGALPRDAVIVQGGARGADTMAREIAEALGNPVETHEADFSLYGVAAGPIRNTQMLTDGADLVVAFWDGESRGTKHMIAAAKKVGVPTMVFK